ncbi:MAG: glycosyltransferase family 9 protein [Janthinobacterium lividum]
MATPLLNALLTRWPEAQITWVADTQYAGILENHPLIHELVAVDTGRWRRLLRHGRLFAWSAEARHLHSEMWRRQFDIAINFHPEKWWMRILCVAPVRIALFASRKPPLTQRLYTLVVSESAAGADHNTDRYLEIATALGCPPASKAMTIGETPDEEPFWDSFCRREKIGQDQPVVVLAPFATTENRVWETDRLAQIVEWLQGDCGARVVLTAGPKEAAAAGQIVQLVAGRSPIVAETLTLRQYIAVLRGASLVICGDSSPMHLAGALGTPYVALFGPTPVAGRAPLSGIGLALAKPLPCAPCDQSGCSNPIFRECLKLITVADVQAAVLALMPSLRRKET